MGGSERGWEEGGEEGEGEEWGLYLTLKCHHQSEFCIQINSDGTLSCFLDCEGQSHN